MHYIQYIKKIFDKNLGIEELIFPWLSLRYVKRNPIFKNFKQR
jgi:hypothetical protein